MALQTSGAISLNDIHVEAGGSSGTSASINDSDIRALIGKASGAQMSFSEWYGASALLGLSAQSSVLSTSSTVTVPSHAIGDIAIATITMTGYWPSYGQNPSITTPSGWTLLSTEQDYVTGPFTKASYYVYTSIKIVYKVLTASNTTFAVSGYSGFSGVGRMTTVQVYRPTSTINSVSAGSLSTASSQTIGSSAASSSVICFGGSIGGVSQSHTWGAGPTYSDGASRVVVNYDTHYMRGSSYVQSTSSPSNVTFSSSGGRTLSGYLEVS